SSVKVTEFPRDVAQAPQLVRLPAGIILQGTTVTSRAPNGLYQTMPVARGQRDDRVRPSKSRRHITLPLVGDLGQLELGVLLALLFTANVIVATTAWYIVGSLLR